MRKKCGNLSWSRSLLLTCLMVSTVYAADNYVDGVVATVGRAPILHSDVLQEMLPMLQTMKADATTPEEQEQKFKELFNTALEQVIEYHILHLEALALGVTIPDDDVESRLAEMKKMYDSTEAFQKALAESGHTIGDFRERVRRQMMAISVSRSKRNQFEKEAVVSESDIAQYYQDHLNEFEYSARYRVRRIFLQAPAAAEERDKVRVKLQGIRDELVAGADFGDVAKKYSDGPEASEGGTLGWVLPGDLVDPLDGAVSSLAVEEVSDVLETEYGLHLVKVEAIETAGSLSLDDARTKIEPLLRGQRGEERYRKWMSSLRKRNNVRILL